MRQFCLSAILSVILAQPAFAAAADVPATPIYEAPDGKKVFYDESYGAWHLYEGDTPFYLNGTTVNKIVWCDNNEVYIANPVAPFYAEAYAKGTYADGKITVKLPQCIGEYYDENGDIKPLYINKMEEVDITCDPYNPDGKYYVICYEEDNTIVYNVDADGNVTLDLGNGDFDVEAGVNPKNILAITVANVPHVLTGWTGFGDAVEKWNVIHNPDPVCPPETAERQEWVFETLGVPLVVDVAVDGNDIYVKDFAPYIRGYWFKGEREGDKISFADGQYMGLNEYDQFYYFRTIKIVFDEETGDMEYVPVEKLTMTFNPETQRYENNDANFMICMSLADISPYFIAESPRLWQQDPELLKAAPRNPSVMNFGEYNPKSGEGFIMWDIPNINVNGAVMDTRRMYYNLYVDNRLYEFRPEQYPLFEEPTVDVPYLASNYYNIDAYDCAHSIFYYFDTPESMSLQSFYVDTDGTTYASEKVLYRTGASIDSPSAAKEAVDVTYTSLSGIAVKTPAPGLYIRTTTYSDGSRQVEKVSVR
ncbi:MAG: hypothetical protein HUK14_11335 [Muribaculaceae bacterium]|nr:hypothetical protein [Muribaculaceae bacterium]